MVDTVTAGIASVGIALGTLFVVGTSTDYPVQLDMSVCAASPEYAGPDCGLAGDDNGDGWVMEDESGWDCRTMGNRVCGSSER